MSKKESKWNILLTTELRGIREDIPGAVERDLIRDTGQNPSRKEQPFIGLRIPEKRKYVSNNIKDRKLYVSNYDAIGLDTDKPVSVYTYKTTKNLKYAGIFDLIDAHGDVPISELKPKGGYITRRTRKQAEAYFETIKDKKLSEVVRENYDLYYQDEERPYLYQKQKYNQRAYVNGMIQKYGRDALKDPTTYDKLREKGFDIVEDFEDAASGFAKSPNIVINPADSLTLTGEEDLNLFYKLKHLTDKDK